MNNGNNMNPRRGAGCLAIVVSLAVSAVTARAVEPRFGFRLYSQSDGIESPGVRSMLQDRQGFLWIGTSNGLFRFDGLRFRPFQPANGLPTPPNVVAIRESPDGRVWVGTAGGIAYVKGDRLIAADLGPDASARGPSAFGCGRDGRFWVAGMTGLFVWDTKQAAGVPRFQRVELPGVPAGARIRAVFVDSRGDTWFSTGKGIGRLHGGTVDLLGTAAGVPEEDWGAIQEDRDGRVWLRSRQRVVCREKNRTMFQPAGPPIPEIGSAEAILLDPQGEPVFPSSAGVFCRHGANWKRIGHSEGLPADAVHDMIWDVEGNPWIGTESFGVAQWLGYGEWELWNRENGLSHDIVTAITRDRKGRLWVGTRSGLNLLAPGTATIRRWTRRESLPRDDVRALRETADGSLWIASARGGLARMNLETYQIRVYGPADGLRDNRIIAMDVDPDGRLWVSTQRGVFRIDPQKTTARFENVYIPLPGGLQKVYGMVYGRENRIWVATNKGLLLERNGEWTRFRQQDGLRQDRVVCAVEAPDGALLVSYDAAVGISRVLVKRSGIEVTHFGSPRPLRSGDVSFIGFDALRQLWVGTDVGVDVLAGGSWTHIDARDGLSWHDTTLWGFYAERDGGVWIGANGGLAYRRPGARRPAKAPPVILSEIRFGGVAAEPAQSLRVPSRRASLSVEFAGFSSIRPDEIRYRYRMVGLSDEWIETSQNHLEYPNLPAGPYRFEVMARSATGEWNGAAAGFDFEVMAPWWRTWWALSGTGLMAGLIAAGIWRRRVRRLLEAKRQLESAVEERTRQIERDKRMVIEQKQQIEQLLVEARQASRLKGEFLANISHEIRTPLNGVLGMAALALDTELTAEQREYLETVRSCGESLLRLLNEILDLSKIEAGRMVLENSEFSLSEIVERIVRMISPAAQQKAIRLNSETDPRLPCRLMGDGGRLEQVLLNLASNAVKFTLEGSVSIAATLEEETSSDVLVNFSVTDTGIGVSAEKQRAIFEPFQQADGSTTRRFGGTGLGLAICERLVDLMGGHIGIESEPHRGSRFYFTVRLGRCMDILLPNPPLADCAARAYRSGLVLVVEDNPVSQRVLASLLEKRGCRVRTAHNGRLALESFERERFDLVFMDIQMPELDGLAATRAIREHERNNGCHTPVIMLTASALADERERCMIAGADGFLTKPLQPDQLDETLNAFLR